MVGTFFGTLFSALTIFVVVVAMLRASGKRTLARMNIFDLIVVVALGSIMARTILAEGTLFQGIFALLILAGLQYLLEWLSAKDPRMRKIFTAEPSLLFHRGQFLRRNMKAQRISEDDVLTAVRQSGVLDLAEVEAVVLENNGDFSVIRHREDVSASTLGDMGQNG